MAETVLRSDARRNRLAILAAAREVFAERGLDAQTAEVARRAQVGPATLFRHFASKDELVVATLMSRLDQMRDLADRAAERGEDDPLAGIELFLRAGLRLHLDDRGFSQAASATAPARFAAVLDGVHAHIEQRLAPLLVAAQREGRLRAGLVVDDLGMALVGAAEAAQKFCDAQPGIEERFMQMIFDGMRAVDAGALAGPAPDQAAIVATRSDREHSGGRSS